jgi:ABC-type transport system involved in multi-copper enzyme maturation permease subunit
MSALHTIAALVRHGWARHRLPLIPIVLAVGVFQFLLTRIAPSPHEVSWMSTMLQMMPPELRALSGGDFALSPAGFLAIGYAHPFFMLLLSAWVVRTSSAAVAGETGAGTMDLLASRPAARWTFVAAGMLTLAAGLAAIVGAAWLGTAIGVTMRPLDVSAHQFLPLVCTAWLLFAAWGGLGLLIGATRREGGQAMGWTIAALAGSFVLDYVARLWAPIAAARPASLFRYYEPPLILMSGISTTTFIVLTGVLAGSVALAVVVAQRRDL